MLCKITPYLKFIFSDHIDIYSASWGPEDDGKTVDGPGTNLLKPSTFVLRHQRDFEPPL